MPANIRHATALGEQRWGAVMIPFLFLLMVFPVPTHEIRIVSCLVKFCSELSLVMMRVLSGPLRFGDVVLYT